MSRRLNSSAHVELARLVAVGAAMLIVTFLVVGRSRAAFVGTTTQPGNHLDSGSVTLTDSDAPNATQMFNVSGMVANQVETRCIQVTYTGTVNPTEVELFAALTSSPPNDGLEAYLDMSVDVGDWGGAASSFPACTNFANGTNIYNGATNTLDDFLTSYPDSANAIATGFDPTNTNDFAVFRITLTMKNDNAAQGLHTDFTLTWQTSS